MSNFKKVLVVIALIILLLTISFAFGIVAATMKYGIPLYPTIQKP